MKTILTYKAVKYLCVAAMVPGTAVVTQTHHKQITRQVHHAKRVVNRIAHKPVFVDVPPIEQVDMDDADIASSKIDLTPVPVACVPGFDSPISDGGYDGGVSIGGGGIGGGIGIGGGSIGGGGGGGIIAPPISTVPTVPPVTSVPVTPVPEVSTWFMTIAGFGVIGKAMRNHNRKRKALSA
jgi:hypothetical protein